MNCVATVTGQAPTIESRPATGTSSYRNDAMGHRGRQTQPNGVASTDNYNQLNRLTNLTIYNLVTEQAPTTLDGYDCPFWAQRIIA